MGKKLELLVVDDHLVVRDDALLHEALSDPRYMLENNLLD